MTIDGTVHLSDLLLILGGIGTVVKAAQVAMTKRLQELRERQEANFKEIEKHINADALAFEHVNARLDRASDQMVRIANDQQRSCNDVATIWEAMIRRGWTLDRRGKS